MKRAAAEGDATGGGSDGCTAEFITEWPPPAAATARGASSPAKVPGKQAKWLSSVSDCSSGSDDSRGDDDAEADAAVALAKFWRQSAAPHQPAPHHGLLSSSSRIAIIARSAPGRTFLAQRAVVLKRLAALPSPRQAALLHALASTLNYLGDVRHALQAAAQAVSLAPRKRNYEWLRVKLARHAAAQAAARASWPAPCPAGCRLRSVQRLHCSQLTTRRFFEEFALTRRPVVITGLQVTRDAWTLDLIEREAGALCVDVKAVAAVSSEWAGLELQRSTTVAQFIHSMRSGGDSSACNERGYLFDWSLPQVSAPPLPLPLLFLRSAQPPFAALPCPRVAAHHPSLLCARSAAEAARRLHVQGPSIPLHFRSTLLYATPQPAGLLAQPLRRPRWHRLRHPRRHLRLQLLDGRAPGKSARLFPFRCFRCCRRLPTVSAPLGYEAVDHLGRGRAAALES
jgi:hypothetical protein